MTDDAAVAGRSAEDMLAEILADVLGLGAVGPDDDFFEVGGDSAAALTAVARARRNGLELGLEQLYRARTPRRIVLSGITRRTVSAPGRDAPLLPAQARVVRQSRSLTPWPAMGFVLECADPLDPAVLEAALRAVIAHHDGLRLRLRQERNGDWRHGAVRAEDHRVFEVAEVSAGALSTALQEIAERLHAGLDPARGPMLRAAAIAVDGAAPRHILVVLHHFCADAHSATILRDDLESAYGQVMAGAAVTLPPPTGSILEFAAACDDYATGPLGERERRFWEAEADRLRAGSPGRKRALARRYEFMSLEVDRTPAAALLREGSRGLFEAVAGALAYTLRGNDLMSFAYLQHGRAPRFAGLDLSRTVGWPMTEVPVLVDASAAGTVQDAIVAVRAETARLPQGGLGFLSMYGSVKGPRAEAIRAVYESVQVVLNVTVATAEESGRAFRFAAQSPDLNGLQSGYSCAMSLVCAGAHPDGLSLRWGYEPTTVPPGVMERTARTHLDALLALASAPGRC